MLLLIEYCRVSRFFLIGPVIDKFMRQFVDERDPGPLILTHIYLLIGCSIPLILTLPAHKGIDESSEIWKNASLPAIVAPFSGILILGLGDTAVSDYQLLHFVLSLLIIVIVNSRQ